VEPSIGPVAGVGANTLWSLPGAGSTWPGARNDTECGSIVPFHVNTTGVPTSTVTLAGMYASTAMFGFFGSFTPTCTVTSVRTGALELDEPSDPELPAGCPVFATVSFDVPHAATARVNTTAAATAPARTLIITSPSSDGCQILAAPAFCSRDVPRRGSHRAPQT